MGLQSRHQLSAPALMWANMEDSDDCDGGSEYSKGSSWRTGSNWDDKYNPLQTVANTHRNAFVAPAPIAPAAPPSNFNTADGQAVGVLGTEWTASSSPKAFLWQATDNEGLSPTVSSAMNRTATHHLSAMPPSAFESCIGHRQRQPDRRSPAAPPAAAPAPAAPAPAAAPAAATAAVAATPDMPPQEPTLVWCEAGVGSQAEHFQAVRDSLGGGDKVDVQQFESTAQFTRWLFAQPRGDVSPWVVLVVGWREAKPCAMAIEAACTGDASQLRPDARRPELTPILGHVASSRVGVAVKQMIIKVGSKPEQEERALLWARHEGRHMMGSMDIKITSDLTEVQSSVAAGLAVPRSRASSSGSAKAIVSL